jgi:hypothetical protein
MKKVSLEIIASAAGTSVYLGETRIAGPKPTPSGRGIYSWLVDVEDIRRVIERAVERPAEPEAQPDMAVSPTKEKVTK